MKPLNSGAQCGCPADTKVLEAPSSEDEQELLEWRDLQNAQIESVRHVWDNPQDEVWNDVQGNDPPATAATPYPDPYSHLTDDQYDLFDRMSEISEEAYYAGWNHDNEYNIWLALTQGRADPGYHTVNPRLLRRCKKLSDETRGWIRWTPDGPLFVPMAQWLVLVESWRAKRNAAAQ